jgi:hypothetical protein
MSIEFPTFKGLKRRRIKEEVGAQNMRFCETNPIGQDAFFDAMPYPRDGYGKAAQKVNRVRLERNGAMGEVATIILLPHSSGSLVAGSVTGMSLPRERKDFGGWGFYPRVLALESSAWEWYSTEIEVDLNQAVVR